MQFCESLFTLALLSLMPLIWMPNVAAAFISKQLPGMLCIKRKQETIICSDLVTDEMASCIVQLHCTTGCNANSSFYGKGKKSLYDQVMNSNVAQRQLSR